MYLKTARTVRNTSHPGARLRERRVELGLTLRDVEARSREIANELRNRPFELPFGRLSELERNGQPPNVFRLHTLVRICRLRTSELLQWYGVPFR